MGFLGGVRWDQNPGAAEAQNYLNTARDYISGMPGLMGGDRGIWKALMGRGTPQQNALLQGLIYDPSMADKAVKSYQMNYTTSGNADLDANRLAKTAAQAELAAGEGAIGRKRDLYGALSGVRNQRDMFKQGSIVDLYKTQAQTARDAYEKTQTQGWGSLVAGLAGAGLSAWAGKPK